MCFILDTLIFGRIFLEPNETFRIWIILIFPNSSETETVELLEKVDGDLDKRMTIICDILDYISISFLWSELFWMSFLIHCRRFLHTNWLFELFHSSFSSWYVCVGLELINITILLFHFLRVQNEWDVSRSLRVPKASFFAIIHTTMRYNRKIITKNLKCLLFYKLTLAFWLQLVWFSTIHRKTM